MFEEQLLKMAPVSDLFMGVILYFFVNMKLFSSKSRGGE